MPDPGVDTVAAPVRHVLSLGSNVGAREAFVLEAARLVEASASGPIRLSSLYETAPVGVTGQRPFVNAVVELPSLLSPADLLKRLKKIERFLGRRTGHNEPREIDIDIVASGETVLETADLTVPHPRYPTRAFVLIPLAEICPGFVCPVSALGIDKMIEGLDRPTAVERISRRKQLSLKTS